MPPRPAEPRHRATEQTVAAEEEVKGEATSGWFSSFLSQGYYSYAPSVADPHANKISTGGGATSGSHFFHSISETVLICAISCRSRSGNPDACA